MKESFSKLIQKIRVTEMNQNPKLQKDLQTPPTGITQPEVVQLENPHGKNYLDNSLNK